MASRGQRERARLSYFLRSPGSVSSHCGGINALCLSGDNGTLYTASRDATVRAWNLRGAQPTPEAVLNGHTDWVTAVSVLDAGAVVTGSCDSTIRLWRARAQGNVEALAILQGHRDYVTSIATVRGSSTFASGAFGGELFLWDAEALRPIIQASSGTAPSPALPFSAADGQKESVYSLAMAGQTIVSGSSDSAVRVFDARSNQVTATLRGHTDNVRVLQLDPSGRLCLSGGSDGTVRLWDLGQQRCVQTICPSLGDSVWALVADEAFGTVWSGGREGRVYATVVSNRQSRLVLTESKPITALVVRACNPVTRGLWVGTTNSSVSQWMADEPGLGSPMDSTRPGSAQVGSRHNSGAFIASGSPGMVVRTREHSLSKQQILALLPNQSAPVITIPGVAGVVRAEMLQDKRTALTQDTDGNIALWDLALSSVVRSFGQADFEEKKKELHKTVAMPAWCMLDVRLGHLGVHLEPSSALSAETYAADVGVEGATDDQKLNLGQQALLMITAGAVQRKKAAAGAAGALAAELGGSPAGGSPAGPGSGGGSSPGGTAPGSPGGGQSQLTPMAFSPPPTPALILYDGSDGLSHWMGPDTDLSALPAWVATCVLNRSTPVAESPKCSFMLISANPSDLPPLSPCKFSAPKILRIQKVYPFVYEKLLEAGYVDPLPAPGADSPLTPSLQLLELFCNDQKISLDMSLNTVQHYVWKRPGEDLQIVYKRKGAAGGPGGGRPLVSLPANAGDDAASGGVEESATQQSPAGGGGSLVGGRLRWLTGGSSTTPRG